MATYLQKDRVYELTIGDTKTGNGFVIKSSDNQSPLNVKFQINKSSDNKKGHNNATIEVYNLNPAHILLLEAEYLACTFSAGYKATGPLVVVQGNVVECSTIKKGVDYITQITMGEGYTDLNHVKLTGMVAPGKTYLDVIHEVSKNCPNISTGSLGGDGLNNPVMFGYGLKGTPAEVLRDVCESQRLEYNVSGGVLNTSNENAPLTKNTVLAPVINVNSGLVEVPFYTSAEGKKLPQDQRKRRGVQFKCLLNANMNPGYIVRLESQVITGVFRINTSRFTGEYRGNDWYVECFCSVIEAEDLK